MSQTPTIPPAAPGAKFPASANPAQAASGSKSVKKKIAGPRKVRLALTRVDPWSVMKVSFLLSFAAFIVIIVGTAVVWFMLDRMQVFSRIQELVGSVFDQNNNAFQALVEYLKFSRAIAMAAIVGVVNIVLTTALATIGAFLYNITASLVGGVHLTLADD
ncbi:Transmembrane domain of uncharacterised function (DUF3566) [Actinomyces bovis]|uniref:Transmembrane domain of uncharacterized function (DUF3566) n=1 Tax=Actinomyces bovis TaxID=1658 RepID=A0ABY1VQI7_9ACTO|nr:DUF3566 domain-containing protein [Actinomyces bovis]SPT54393.1 Transmembrane domain of uncharacterised function (DUF3566) [Actinomyces bovis]VEG56050.1 Transmembrane domain of uncharacterised function (DUF3566) [Actinomyces israelii]